MNNTQKIFVAAAASAAVGAVLGILFAPDNGAETRRRIAKGGKRLTQKLNGKHENGNYRLADVRDEFKHIINEMESKAEKLTKRLLT